MDSRVRVYDVLFGGASVRFKDSLDDAAATVRALAFSVDSKLLASGADDHKVRVYALGDGATRLQYTLNDARGRVLSAAFSTDSKFLFSGSMDTMLRVYKMVQGGERVSAPDARAKG